MNKTNFTPGPWRVDTTIENGGRPRWAVLAEECEDFGITYTPHIATGNYVDVLLPGNPEHEVLSVQFKANAHLIAAGPEMYEALGKAHAYIYRHAPASVFNVVGAVIESARAKARGEQS